MSHAGAWRVPTATLGAFSVWITGWEIATLMAAAQLSPALRGAPALEFMGQALYWPWLWLMWNESREAPEAVALVGYGAALAAFVLIIAARISSPRKRSDSYGSARWGTSRELERAGLGEDGVVLAQTADAKYALRKNSGKYEWTLKRHGELLADPGPGHVLCAAPTRSGKGIGLCIPTLLSWRHSALIYDIKKELWHYTAGWRRQFSYCWRFEPTDPNSLRYNPLFEVPRGDGDVRQAQNIADILIDPNGTEERRDHWQKTACDLLVGAILHVLYAGKRKSLAGVLELLADPERDHEQILGLMMSTPHLGDRPHPQVVVAARGVLNKHPNERSGVFSTALSCLGIYLDPVIARNTDESDFRPSQLNSLDRPVSLYLVVPPSDSDRLRPLIRLMLNQIGKRLTESMDYAPVKKVRPTLWARLRNALQPPRAAEHVPVRHRLLYLIDEFPTLGKLPLFETALAVAAGYGIKFFLVAQSLNQIERVYGPNHSFLDNSAVRVVYAANDERTAKRISEMLGQRTEVQQRTTRTRRGGAFVADSVSEASSEHARPLLTPGEVLTLPFDEALVFVNGAHPYRARKIMYYQDERFRDRAGMPPPDSAEEQRAELPEVQSSEWGSGTAAAFEVFIRGDRVAHGEEVAADVAAAVGSSASSEALSPSEESATDDDVDAEESHSDGRECAEEVAW